METIHSKGIWAGFFFFIAIMLLVDIILVGREKAHRVAPRESLAWVVVWITLALTFNALLWGYLNLTTTPAIATQKALEFFTGYLIELSLSVDNMFVFLMIFNYFAVPEPFQKRVLLFGVFGAIVLRLIMILLGVWLIAKFHWILLVFGVFLIVTGIKMLWLTDRKADLGNNLLVRLMNRYFNVTHQFEGGQFFLIKTSKLFVTPLFLVVVLIEITDLVFAMDSIPAIFAVTDDPFIVFTSNIFAILGLRSLYFLLANMMDRFYLLKYGLAVILIFVGSKMLIAKWYSISVLLALSVIILILLTCILLSLVIKNRSKNIRT